MIVSFTTISSRIDKVLPVVENILEQDFSGFKLVLYVSKEPWLLDKGVGHIPCELERLRRSENFDIKWTKNTGPYRKLVPALIDSWGGDEKIVTIDDDVLYPKDFLKTLDLASDIYNCPVAFRGREIKIGREGEIMPYKTWAGSSLSGASSLKVPTGKDGVIYKASHFSSKVLDMDAALKVAKTADDLWFKWNTVLSGYSSCLLFDSLSESFDVVDEEDQVTLYDSFNRAGKNDDVVNGLEEIMPIKKKLMSGGLRC